MKLRNKQSGKIYDSDQITFVIYGGEYGEVEETYLSLAELNQDWEEVKQKEPLIKDEKIRKAVRVWAEANRWTGEVKVQFIDFSYHKSWGLEQLKDNNEIHFSERMPGLNHLAEYTIDELCGEEEE